MNTEKAKKAGSVTLTAYEEGYLGCIIREVNAALAARYGRNSSPRITLDEAVQLAVRYAANMLPSMLVGDDEPDDIATHALETLDAEAWNIIQERRGEAG